MGHKMYTDHFGKRSKNYEIEINDYTKHLAFLQFFNFVKCFQKFVTIL